MGNILVVIIAFMVPMVGLIPEIIDTIKSVRNDRRYRMEVKRQKLELENITFKRVNEMEG